MKGLGWWPYVENMVHRKTAGRRASNLETKEFNNVLRRILPPKSDVVNPILKPNMLGDIANQLGYALKHDIPFQFLIGFLKEVGIEKAAAKQRAKEYEEWHPNWQPSTKEPKKSKSKETSAKAEKTAVKASKASKTSGKSV